MEIEFSSMQRGVSQISVLSPRIYFLCYEKMAENAIRESQFWIRKGQKF